MADTLSKCFSWALSTKDSAISATAAISVPTTMNGVRRPRGWVHLSDKWPNSGSMNSASTLSSAMIAPDQV